MIELSWLAILCANESCFVKSKVASIAYHRYHYSCDRLNISVIKELVPNYPINAQKWSNNSNRAKSRATQLLDKGGYIKS